MEKKNNWLNILKKLLIATGIVVIISVIATIGIGNYFVNYAILRTGNGGDREVKNKEVVEVASVDNETERIIEENREEEKQLANEWASTIKNEKVEITANDGITLKGTEYIKDEQIKFESTSGGAFSAIVDTFCDENYVIFGAESKGLLVWHSYITDKKDLAKFRKSKYSQSKMGNSYQQAKDFLNSGKKVLFSGTPCQISGLKAFLRNTNQDNLLTVEVICEGVPSPLYIRKYEQSLKKKFDALIESIDYRYKGHTFLGNHKWDFQIMRALAKNNRGGKMGL